jgi:phosphoribosyl-ATP pyrophosphohydrolase/phosphoribosyl-AMP cyclohydrolase
MNFDKVNIIDLDRHYGKNYNEEIISTLCSMKECRVGGGVRKSEDIEKLFSLGAYKVIITTCATPELLRDFPNNRIVVGIDSIDRRTGLPNDVPERMKILEPYASDFQYICVETDGKMKGGDLKRGIEYAKLTDKPYAVVGGITYPHEIDSLRNKGIYAVVGRAIFENLFGDKL